MEGYGTNLLGSSAILTVLGVAAFSAYVSGPLIIERLSQKMNWRDECIENVEREIRITTPQAPAMPRMSCNSAMRMAGRDLAELARAFGIDQACQSLEYQIELKEFNAQERLSAKLESAPSRCECAVSRMISEHRGAVALHAASARLVTPLPIQNLTSEFTASLNSPSCASIANLGAKIGG